MQRVPAVLMQKAPISIAAESFSFAVIAEDRFVDFSIFQSPSVSSRVSGTAKSTLPSAPVSSVVSANAQSVCQFQYQLSGQYLISFDNTKLVYLWDLCANSASRLVIGANSILAQLAVTASKVMGPFPVEILHRCSS